jgi:PEP-CTERM motif
MKKTLALTAMAFAFVAMAATGSASTLCTAGGTAAIVGNPTGVSNGFDCTIGGLEFSNFRADNAGNSAGLAVQLIDASVANGVITLNFNPNMGLDGTQDISLFFMVTGGITQIDLGNGGTISTQIQERACSTVIDSSGSCTGGPANQLGGISIVSGGGQTGQISLPFTTTSPVFIFKDILKPANSDSDPNTHLTRFSQSFHTAVPEPMTLSMMGIGLLGLGLARRRQQGKK